MESFTLILSAETLPLNGSQSVIPSGPIFGVGGIFQLMTEGGRTLRVNIRTTQKILLAGQELL